MTLTEIILVIRCIYIDEGDKRPCLLYSDVRIYHYFHSSRYHYNPRPPCSCVHLYWTHWSLVILGKSTFACALSQSLHSRGKLSYILDGDNIRHGLNRDLTFRAEDRSENIRRIGEFLLLTIYTHTH